MCCAGLFQNRSPNRVVRVCWTLWSSAVPRGARPPRLWAAAAAVAAAAAAAAAATAEPSGPCPPGAPICTAAPHEPTVCLRLIARPPLSHHRPLCCTDKPNQSPPQPLCRIATITTVGSAGRRTCCTPEHCPAPRWACMRALHHDRAPAALMPRISLHPPRRAAPSAALASTAPLPPPTAAAAGAPARAAPLPALKGSCQATLEPAAAQAPRRRGCPAAAARAAARPSPAPQVLPPASHLARRAAQAPAPRCPPPAGQARNVQRGNVGPGPQHASIDERSITTSGSDSGNSSKRGRSNCAGRCDCTQPALRLTSQRCVPSAASSASVNRNLSSSSSCRDTPACGQDDSAVQAGLAE